MPCGVLAELSPSARPRVGAVSTDLRSWHRRLQRAHARPSRGSPWPGQGGGRSRSSPGPWPEGLCPAPRTRSPSSRVYLRGVCAAPGPPAWRVPGTTHCVTALHWGWLPPARDGCVTGPFTQPSLPTVCGSLCSEQLRLQEAGARPPHCPWALLSSVLRGVRVAGTRWEVGCKHTRRPRPRAEAGRGVQADRHRESPRQPTLWHRHTFVQGSVPSLCFQAGLCLFSPRMFPPAGLSLLESRPVRAGARPACWSPGRVVPSREPRARVVERGQIAADRPLLLLAASPL